jgi:hypothetical protein
MGGTALVNRFKNNKGQTVVEAIVIIHIMLILFFAMLMFSTYNFNKMVVLYAANSAVSKAVLQAPNGLSLRQIESLMKSEADRILGNGIVLVNPTSTAKANVTSKGIVTFSVTSSGKQGLRLPLLDGLLDNQDISFTVEYNYFDEKF